MKTIITSTGNKLVSEFDIHFGRAGWFCVYDQETKEFDFVENKNKDAASGAGTKSSEKIAELGAKQVISGHFGPKAKDLLERLNIQMLSLDENELKISEIIEKLENN